MVLFFLGCVRAWCWIIVFFAPRTLVGTYFSGVGLFVLSLGMYVCAGLAAINVPAATIPNTTTIPERTSVSSLLEVVSEDLLNLNNNLKSVSFLLS